MAKVCIIIEDLHNHNVDVQIHCDTVVPDNALFYTNAMHIMKEVEHHLRLISKELNDKKHQEITVI